MACGKKKLSQTSEASRRKRGSSMISVANPNKRGKYKNSKTGRFFMKNPQKFLGTEIPIYKSQLEWLCMRYLDENPSVV